MHIANVIHIESYDYQSNLPHLLVFVHFLPGIDVLIAKFQIKHVHNGRKDLVHDCT